MLVFLGAAAVYWLAAAPREITRTDEHRYITVAREFTAVGGWFHCHRNGEEYFDKPPVFFWAVALCRELGLSWTSAGKLPSVLGAAFATTLVFDVARRLYGRVAAWASAVALVSTIEFLALAVRGNLDGLLSAFTTLATYAFVRATLCAADERARTRWAVVGFLAIGLGILEKGPAAVVIPGAAALAALVWDDRWAQVSWRRWAVGVLLLVAVPDVASGVLPGTLALALGVVLFVLVTAFWRSRWGALVTWRWALVPLALLLPAAWVVAAAQEAPSGWGYVWNIAFGQAVMHAAGGIDKVEPWWFYGKSFPAGLMPWTPLLPGVVWAWLRHRSPDRTAADRFAMAWLVAPLVVMSLSRAKRDLYLVPIYPAAALLAGRAAMVVAADAARLTRPAVRWGLRVLAGVAALAGAAMVVLGAVGMLHADGFVGRIWWQWPHARDRVGPWFFPAVVSVGVLLAVAAVRLLRVRDLRAAVQGLAACAAAVVLYAAFVDAPLQNALYSRTAFLEAVRARVGDHYLGDYGGADYAPNWICDRTVVPILDEHPQGRPMTHAAVRRAAEEVLADTPGPVYFVVDRERLEKRDVPEGAKVLMDDGRRLDESLVLLGRE